MLEVDMVWEELQNKGSFVDLGLDNSLARFLHPPTHYSATGCGVYHLFAYGLWHRSNEMPAVKGYNTKDVNSSWLLEVARDADVVSLELHPPISYLRILLVWMPLFCCHLQEKDTSAAQNCQITFQKAKVKMKKNNDIWLKRGYNIAVNVGYQMPETIIQEMNIIEE
ncbi:hypothetical protein AAES_44070 [Amazona aestiva]|uniref:Uncharacterized protein n=1 Tax=Amazona aestiva TaxID=12930 RepID=A0A0Q3RHA2_AMAAE|nr:hypothetical protein AAES_44070 [Amazona aestiva]